MGQDCQHDFNKFYKLTNSINKSIKIPFMTLNSQEQRTVLTCVSPRVNLHSLASVIPPAEMANVASFSGISGLEEIKKER